MADVRFILTDEPWAMLGVLIAEVQACTGAPPETRDQPWVEAVLSRAGTGIPWRDWPVGFGAGDAVYHTVSTLAKGWGLASTVQTFTG